MCGTVFCLVLDVHEFQIKDAGATVDLHRMAVADTLAIDRYLDENCLLEPETPKRKESVREMKKRNKDVEKIKRLVAEGSKRWVRYDEGAILYSVGIHTFRKLARDAKACYKVGGRKPSCKGTQDNKSE